jgi:NADP-dependent 3-hydroxy acid dehydrogenase YdfG
MATPSSSERLLEGRSAVVTGASRGIGLAVSRALVHAGVRTIMLSRSEATLAAAAASLGDRALPHACDVANADQVRAMAAFISGELGSAPDVIVNNAGLFPLANIEETSLEQFEEAVRVNLVAPFHVMRAFLPHMRTRATGHIVLIGSVADRHVFPGNATYAATKFGARAMHEALRMETRGSGIRTTLISPSATDTPIWDPVDPDNREGFTRRADMLQPDAVADAVLWAITRPASVNVDELRLSRS